MKEMRKTLFMVSLYCCLATITSFTLCGNPEAGLKVGDTVQYGVEIQPSTTEKSVTHVVSRPGSTFIRLHIILSLESSDTVQLFDNGGVLRATYDKSRNGSFWAHSVDGDEAKIVLNASPGNASSLTIDSFGYGYEHPKEDGGIHEGGSTTDSNAQSLNTEGQFAVKLAERIGLGKNLSENKAIGLLATTGITPREGWNPKSKATEGLVVRTQVPISHMLFKMSQRLKVPSPPTLRPYVLEPPYGPQTIYFALWDLRVGESTEGLFAVKLAEKLCLVKEPSEKEAVSLLSQIGIKPDDGWNPEAMATELFVARIHVSMVEMLKEVAEHLRIPLPPTININVYVEE